MRKTVFSAFFVLWYLACGASVPMLINYPGKLTNKDGSPVTASKNISFSFYDSETGGSQKWSGSYQVDVSKGVFNVLLGSGLYPFGSTVDFSQDYWLEMKVEGETLIPRQRISSVVYALRSEYCNRADTPMVISGCGDIDENVSEKCYFVLSKVPRSITLYLYGERFNTQYYTELAAHSHNGNTEGESNGHTHLVSHDHSLIFYNPTGEGCTAVRGADFAPSASKSLRGVISAETPTSANVSEDHKHAYTTSTVGVSSGYSIGAQSKSYLNDMRVFLDGINVSNEVTGSLLSKTTLSKFGDGTSLHSINSSIGSGAIDMTALISSIGQHFLVFKQAGANQGGRIRYYLHVLY